MNKDTQLQLALSVGQLAAALDVSTRHVERLDAAEKIPAPIHIGHAKRWRVADIDRWLHAGCPDRAAWTAEQDGEPR